MVGSRIFIVIVVPLLTLFLKRLWDILLEYFDFEYDVNEDQTLDPNKKYMFFEMPHGVFPMGQVKYAIGIEYIYMHTYYIYLPLLL